MLLCVPHRIVSGGFSHPLEGSTTSPSDIALGLYGVLFAYDGW